MLKILFATAVLVAPMAAGAATVQLDSTVGGNSGRVVQASDGSFKLDQTGSSIVYLDLAAGTYNITPSSNTYESWNRWSQSTGCDASGANCDKGYQWSIAYFMPETVVTDGKGYADVTKINQSGPNDGDFFETPEQGYDAVAGKVLGSFTLGTDQKVGFLIYDNIITDNQGGVEFDVDLAPVPLPASAALLVAGVAGFGALRRRRKA